MEDVAAAADSIGETVEHGDGVASRGGGGDGDDDFRLEADDGGTLTEVGGGDHKGKKVWGARPACGPLPGACVREEAPPEYGAGGKSASHGERASSGHERTP